MLNNILMFIAGIGVFIFGIKLLSDNLEKICGNKMRKEIHRFSNNRFSATLFGFSFGTLFQSSTASLIMVVGFTTAGITTLFQALSITVGINIASAIPGFLISFTSFNITTFFCAIAGVGAFMLIFSKRTLLRNISNAIIGFSLLFIGMELLSSSMAFLNTDPGFINFFATVKNPVLLILIGTLFTMLIQSSLGTIAVLLPLLGTVGVVGAISIESAACLVYGANLGTAITTTIVSSLSANTDGKRVALYHTVYSLFGAVLFGLLSIAPWIETCLFWIKEPSFKLAFINLIFNVTVAIIALPLIKPSVWLMTKILPSKKRKNKNILDIDDNLSEATGVALAKASEKIILFFDEMEKLYKRTVNFINDADNTAFKKLQKDLSTYNTYINKFTSYIVKITTTDSFDSANNDLENLLIITKQIERNNRNCLKILNVLKQDDKKTTFSLRLKKYINTITENTNMMYILTKPYIKDPECKFLSNKSLSSYQKIIDLSQENSKAKFDAKSFVISNGFASKLSTEKSTSYLEILSYLGLISNNILDIIFALIAKTKKDNQENYEQLQLEVDGLDNKG